LDNLGEIMSYNLLDCETVVLNFEEMTNVKVDPTCTQCKQTLIAVVSKEHLLKCFNCNRYSLTKSGHYNTSVTLMIGKTLVLAKHVSDAHECQSLYRRLLHCLQGTKSKRFTHRKTCCRITTNRRRMTKSTHLIPCANTFYSTDRGRSRSAICDDKSCPSTKNNQQQLLE
jgi:hypothetical protein